MKYAVDRIIDDIVVLESLDTGEKLEVSKSKFLGTVKDGDIVCLKNNLYVIDNNSKEERMRLIMEKLKRVKRDNFVYLVLVRHGQSVWNMENRFTGWTDVELSSQGVEEAIEAGKKIKELNIKFDAAYTSYLKRAQNTLKNILNVLELNIEPSKAWQLNERHYGALQGLNKDETREKYGAEQVKIWRRSFDVKPPLLTEDDERYPGNNPLYKDLKKEELPLSESLKDTIERVVPYYENNIKKDLLSGKNVIVAAHGNSLRALIKYLENISDDDIVELEIPTGKPVIYKLDTNLDIIEKF